MLRVNPGILLYMKALCYCGLVCLGVDLRCLDFLMPQEFLNGGQVYTLLGQKSCKSMPA